MKQNKTKRMGPKENVYKYIRMLIQCWSWMNDRNMVPPFLILPILVGKGNEWKDCYRRREPPSRRFEPGTWPTSKSLAVQRRAYKDREAPLPADPAVPAKGCLTLVLRSLCWYCTSSFVCWFCCSVMGAMTSVPPTHAQNDDDGWWWIPFPREKEKGGYFSFICQVFIHMISWASEESPIHCPCAVMDWCVFVCVYININKYK